MSAPLKVGDEVRVLNTGLIIPVWYPGRVTKVGRKLVTIAWDDREAKFRLIDRRIHDYEGECRFEVGLERDALGFTWDRSAVPSLRGGTTEHAVWRFTRMLAEYVWDAAVLEGNPFTYPEVQTLLDGVTVGGRQLTDERQVLNLAAAANELAQTALDGGFELDKVFSDRFHLLIARDEALESGHFRGEGRETLTPKVSLGEHGRYTPPETEPGGANLYRIYEQGVAAITGSLNDPFEQGAAYFLFGALNQFYFDGNKRTARYMMNGWLMSHGIDAISIPAARRQEFNTEMIDFFRGRDGTRMFQFLASCWEEAQ